MANRIKGITVEIGGDTTGLSKALSGINKEINTTQQELKDVERLLKLDPGNTELLRQKYDLLNKSIESTETKLDSLKNAEKQVQAQFQRGEIGESQYNAIKREVIETESKLGKLRIEAQKTDNAIKGIDEKPIDDVAKAADDAESALKDAGKEASNFGDYLKAEVIVEGAKGIASGLKNIAEESKDYLKIMGSLEISSQKAGYTAEQTSKSYKTLYGVLGDDQTAATTTANLQALGLSQQKLEKVINGTIGAWAVYGDSIPIDSLSEAINETVKTGTVTGTFADVLNWAGTSEDDFNKKLQSANSESERANLILQELANQGLIEAGEAWQENNEALVENNQANADLQEQLAKLGETVMPIITDITQGIADLIEQFNELDPDTQKFILGLIGITAVAAPLISSISGIGGAIGGLSNPIGWLVLAIGGIIAGILWIANNWEDTTFMQWWNNVGKNDPFFSNAAKSIIEYEEALNSFWDSELNRLNNFSWDNNNFTEWWNTVGKENPFLSSVATSFSENLDFIKETILYFWDEITSFSWEDTTFAQGWNAIEDFFTITIPEAWNELVYLFDGAKTWWSNLWQGIGDFFSGIWDGIIGFFTVTIPNAWQQVVNKFNGVVSWWSNIWNNVKNIFSNVFNSLKNVAKTPLNAIIGLLNGVIGGLNKMISGLNKISFNIPDWVPGIGGNSFGINIGKIGKIPYLANGGVLSQGSAVVGEAGPELLTVYGSKAIVQPLTQSNTTNTNNSFGGITVNVYSNGDISDTAERIAEEIQQAVMRKGMVFA